MPLAKAFDDRFGHANPSATSSVVSVTIHNEQQRATYIIHTWKDPASKAANDVPVEELEVIVQDADFTTYFAQGALSGGGKHPIKNAEDHALLSPRFAGAAQT
jgi:hypothetical protein